ncbi:hypothetical protein Sphch_0415 [Sphingobium chlorophenolicum L-1]|uniref:Uncharacterized protein n=1 Tax=Sphingobium chlorophenolicum L-1 TaxID=690566 RepID=F6EWI0_SPHCR|nr:hypothetical protein Sphch_0415 [Sphingobium chlorophenolicum L-1]
MQNGGRHFCRSPLPSCLSIRFSFEMRSSDSARDRSALKALLSCRLRSSGRSAVFPQPVLFIRCPTFTFARAQHLLSRTIGFPHLPSGPCFFPDARKDLQVTDFSPTLASRFLCLPVFPIRGCSHQKRVAQSGILHLEDAFALKLWINVDNFSHALQPPGDQPSGASAKPENSKPGTTTQLANVQPPMGRAACQ